jgi:hypothetical protein
MAGYPIDSAQHIQADIKNQHNENIVQPFGSVLDRSHDDASADAQQPAEKTDGNPRGQ